MTRREWGFLLFLILVLPPLFSPVFAQENITQIQNTTIIVTDGQYVDEGLFWFIAVISIIIFLISVFVDRFQDLTSGIASIFLFAAAWLSTRVARFDVYSVLNPRIINETNGTVIQESQSMVHTVTYAHADPLVTIAFWILFGISMINFIRVLVMIYVYQKEEEES